MAHTFPDGHTRTNHWDLMLEHDGVLLTWALREPFGTLGSTRISSPSSGDPKKARQIISAEKLADHRLAYLEFEGQISGDRGSVKRVLEGEFYWLDVQQQKTAMLSFDGTQCSLEFVEQEQSDELEIRISNA
ncbi:MAG: DNA polymerase ligase N-terminal domain-containing protein [Mariniblastus sp.]